VKSISLALTNTYSKFILLEAIFDSYKLVIFAKNREKSDRKLLFVGLVERVV